MRYLLSIFILLSTGLLFGQSSDWSRIQALPSGAPLVVTAQRNLLCTLSFVSDDEIGCDRRGRTLLLSRSRIRRIQLAHPRRGAILGGVVGGAAGAALAVNVSSGDEQPSRAGGILAGTAAGAFLGATVGGISGRFYGSTIYVKP